jgi:hypothetical protein
MAIYRDRTKQEFNLNDSAIANEDLSSLQYCCVDATGTASGAMKVSKVSGQGGKVYGVLTNAPAADAICELVCEGIVEIRAASTFNAGVELTVHDTNGRVEAASSGDYVVGIAREAAESAGHAVSVLLKPYYKA